ncbi:MAG: FAD-dependent monooxygenase, partial [Phycisphaerales bacterium]|nr:FAD-dependent monooxygenase [Phycisphaerales bacterium]
MSGAREGPVFTVFGAGLAGALLAVRLARLGHRVDLYERRADPRRAGAERGRSINLALSTRGLDALRRVGLADEVMREAIPMRGRLMHARDGSLAYQQYGVTGQEAINSVSRAGLNIALLDAADREPLVRVAFGRRCTRVDFDRREAEVVDAATGEKSVAPFDTAIGADGAFSAVRLSMQMREGFTYSQTYEGHGYKELTIPPRSGERDGASLPGAEGSFRMKRNALHIWPRRSYMMIALPNADGSFTCTLFAPFDGPDGLRAVRTPAEARAYFEARFPDAVALMPALEREFLENPTGSLATVRCFPWHVGGAAALIGDAAHAVVPFYGQGMNASFEDVVALAEEVEARPGDLAGAYRAYGERRKPHADAIADLALANFVEMRDRVGSPAFLRKKKWEQRFARWFRWYTPLYTMVSFTTIPYAEAVERSRAQDARVRRVFFGAALGAAWIVLLIAAVA